MNVSTLTGLLCIGLSLVLSFVLEGSHVSSYINKPAALLVFGGTVGAAVFGTPMPVLRRIPAALKQAFLNPIMPSPPELMGRLMELSRLARREGLLALEGIIAKESDRFLRKGLQLVVDGTDAEVLRSIMEAEVRNRGQRHKQGAAFFSTMGALAPTIGITGTIIHLVHIMGQLDDPSALGPAIAAAFCACLYGVASANLFFFPLGTKLTNLSDQERLASMMVLEALMSLQAGENTVVMEERLNTYLPPSQRSRSAESSTAEQSDERRVA